MLKLPQANGKNVFDAISVVVMKCLDRRMCGSTSSTFFCSHPAGAYGKWGGRNCRTVQRNAVIQCPIDATLPPDDCGTQGAWNRNHPKVFDQITPQHGAESGLSDCQQRASALLLPHRLRARAFSHTFCSDIPEYQKLIGSLAPCLLISIASYTMRYGDDVHCPHPSSGESMTKAAM